jgi:SAM-dependent methyltransferase
MLSQAPLDTDQPFDRSDAMVQRYLRRRSLLYRFLRPPLPLIHNAGEMFLPECSGVKLFLGGAGNVVSKSFLNVDFTAFPGVDIVADVQNLPFADESVVAIECDAVLEHVQTPSRAIAECLRILRPGGYMHVVVPFCHPFHAYPTDYQRWTIDGLKGLLSEFEIVSIGIRTGPTATMLTFVLEFVKVLSPGPLKRPARAICAWIIWPFRYLDLWLNRRPDAYVLANHIYALVRKRNS